MTGRSECLREFQAAGLLQRKHQSLCKDFDEIWTQNNIIQLVHPAVMELCITKWTNYIFFLFLLSHENGVPYDCSAEDNN